MWNYVYYKAYLNFKESTEYNGNESYIAEKIQNFDLNWFPVNRYASYFFCLSFRALAIKGDEEDDDKKGEMLHKLATNVRN